MHRCPGGLPEPWLAEGGAKVGFVAYIEESRMLTMPKGAGWKISMVTRVSVMSMVSRLSIILEGMPDEMGGHDHFFVDPEPWRRWRNTRRRRSSDSDAVRTILTRI